MDTLYLVVKQTAPSPREVTRFRANLDATIGDIAKAEEMLNKIAEPGVDFEIVPKWEGQ